MKWLLIIAGIIVLLILVVVIIGYLLPVKHRASVQRSIPHRVEKVWEQITDFKSYAQWRSDLKAVEAVSETEWMEVDKRGDRLPLKIIKKEAPAVFITEITGKNLPFGGTWEYRLEGRGDHTLITITENGEIYNPVFRFVSRFMMGHNATLEKYAAFLEKSFTQ